jgi:ubiquinone/menaquinone biosynthesis C-methylase UbiE
MSDKAGFWDKHAEKYAQRPIADQESYDKKLEMTRSYFRNDSEVLEIGCGTGSTALAHAPYVKHILATDISPAMIEIARGKAEAGRIDNVAFEVQGFEGLKIRESAYDAILALNLLHLLEAPQAAVTAAWRGLKSGGVFVTSTACVGDMSWYFRVIARVGHFIGLIPLVRVFSLSRLVQGLIDAGFVIDQQWVPKKNAAAFIIARKP